MMSDLELSRLNSCYIFNYNVTLSLLRSHVFCGPDIAWDTKHLFVRSHYCSSNREVISLLAQLVWWISQMQNPNSSSSGFSKLMIQLSTAVPFNLRIVTAGRATEVKLIFKFFWEASCRQKWPELNGNGWLWNMVWAWQCPSYERVIFPADFNNILRTRNFVHWSSANM